MNDFLKNLLFRCSKCEMLMTWTDRLITDDGHTMMTIAQLSLILILYKSFLFFLNIFYNSHTSPPDCTLCHMIYFPPPPHPQKKPFALKIKYFITRLIVHALFKFNNFKLTIRKNDYVLYFFYEDLAWHGCHLCFVLMGR